MADLRISYPGQCCLKYCVESLELHSVEKSTAETVISLLAKAWDEGWKSGRFSEPDNTNPYAIRT